MHAAQLHAERTFLVLRVFCSRFGVVTLVHICVPLLQRLQRHVWRDWGALKLVAAAPPARRAAANGCAHGGRGGSVRFGLHLAVPLPPITGGRGTYRRSQWG